MSIVRTIPPITAIASAIKVIINASGNLKAKNTAIIPIMADGVAIPIAIFPGNVGVYFK